MASKTPIRVALIDSAPAAGRAAVLRHALSVLSAQSSTQSDLRARAAETQVVDLAPEDAETALASGRWVDPDIVLVMIAEDQISRLTEDRALPGGARLPRIPCRSIDLGYKLLSRSEGASDVYFVVRHGSGNGLHTASLLLSGAGGVIDAECLGSPVVAEELLIRLKNGVDPRVQRRVNGLSTKVRERKQSVRLLVGTPATALEGLKDWAHINCDIALPHWEMVLALAQVPRDRLGTKGRTPTQTQLAHSLDEWAHRTGYVGGTNARKRIPLVAELLGIDEDGYEDGPVDNRQLEGEEIEGRRRTLSSFQMSGLAHLPSLARARGFPSRLVPVRGLGDTELAGALYRAVCQMAIREVDPDTPVRIDVAILGQPLLRLGS